jgi:polyhydroxybutyrate depolymerase
MNIYGFPAVFPLLAALFIPVPARSVDVLAENPGDYDIAMDFAGGQRRYIIHVPRAVRSGHPLPLVLVLHGGMGNAESAVAMTRMNEAADQSGFIAVYPDGSGRPRVPLLTWNAGPCCGFASNKNVDDVGFIRALVSWLESTRRIEAGAVFAAGFSNGAMMCHRLGVELSDRIAAIAPVSGSFMPLNGVPARPVSVIMFNGTADRHVPYRGGIGDRSLVRHPNKPAAYAVEFWVKHNGCSATPLMEERNGVRWETYDGGREGTAVVLYTIKGGGHAWPGGSRGRWIGGDRPFADLSASDIILQFFRKHSRK